ncbi:sensor histidine kinase [Thiomicrorhabdus indica]|uniref:sensor histidine kinase n=1 Tax=Thiomicrorhabdus indica TaxID=2267253 RepID=UPI0013EEA115|nr:sensor histidine kinase [Thiomicrorhabdus indica]
MKLIILFALLLFTSVSKATVVIHDSNSSYENFEMGYFQDKTGKLSLEQIQDIKAFIPITNSVALGAKIGNIWYRTSIQNNSQETQTRTFFITEPNLWEVEVFVVENNKLVNNLHNGLSVIKNGSTTRDHPELDITLAANQTQDIYIKVHTPYQHVFKAVFFTEKKLEKYKSIKTSLLHLYFGAIAALLLYNLFLYFSIRDSHYLLYIGFVFFYAIAQLEHNALYPLDSFASVEESRNFAISHILWLAFHTLFSVKLLNIKQYYPKAGTFLVIMGGFLLLLGFIGLYELAIPIAIVSILMILLPFVTLLIAIMLYRRKNKIAIFYIIAQSFFASGIIIFGLLYSGVIEYNYFTRYLNLAGSFAEIILFSFALAYKTRLVMQENAKQKSMLEDYSKLSFLGQTVINIYHQWKAPVNNIYNSINHIEVAKEFRDQNLDKIIDENLLQIKNNTQYLKETASNYLAHYKEIDKPATHVNIHDEILSVAQLLKLELEKINLKITIEGPKDIELRLQKNHFTNLMMILFENAIDVFKLRQVKNPELTLSIFASGTKFYIQIMDNAGGIAEENVDAIFEKSHSASSSTGIGLYLAKEFLLPKLHGKILAKNIKGGAMFTVTLQNKETKKQIKKHKLH